MEKSRVERLLAADEPDYGKLSEMGTDAVEPLRALVESEDPATASKAAYVLSLIGDDDAIDGLSDAASSDVPEVRSAVAAGVRNLTIRAGRADATGGRRKAMGAAADAPVDKVEKLVAKLLADPDPGVRRVTLRSLDADTAAAMESEISELRDNDEDETLRKIADDVLHHEA